MNLQGYIGEGKLSFRSNRLELCNLTDNLLGRQISKVVITPKIDIIYDSSTLLDLIVHLW
jgi:hypothetical protein